MPGCDGGWSLGHIPVTSTPGSSLSHWRSWPSSISWGGAVRTGETFKDCSSGPAIKSLTCSLTLETCELSFEVTVKVSRLIWHFSSALDANYNCCDERFCNHQDHCVSITFITMTNVTLQTNLFKIPAPGSEPLLGCLRVLPEFLTIHQKMTEEIPARDRAVGGCMKHNASHDSNWIKIGFLFDIYTV